MFFLNEYEFEVAAKNAVIDLLSNKINLSIADIQMRNMSSSMGNKTCELYTLRLPGYILNANFSEESGNMYIEIFKKLSEDRIAFKNLKTKVI